MPFRSTKTKRSRPAAHALLADARGTTATEFAIVALPFLFLIFATFELALVFLVNVTLENATAVAARKLRTGQTVATGISFTQPNGGQVGAYEDAAHFKNDVCTNMAWIPITTCNNQLQIDVRSFSSFSNQTQPNPIAGSTFNTQNLCYYSGNSSSSGSATNTIVLIRTYYLWPLITTFLNGGLQNVTTVITKVNNVATTTTGKSYSAVQAAEVFKNEPFATNNTSTSTC